MSSNISGLHVRALVQFSMVNEARPTEIKLLIKSIERDVILEELLSWGYIKSTNDSPNYSKKNYYLLTKGGEEYLVHNFDYVSEVGEILTKKELISYMRLVSSFNATMDEISDLPEVKEEVLKNEVEVKCVESQKMSIENDLIKVISSYNGEMAPIDYIIEESGLSIQQLRIKLRKLNSTGGIVGVKLDATNKFELLPEYQTTKYGVLFENDKERKYFFKLTKPSFEEFSLAVTEFCKKYDYEYNADGMIPIYAIRRATSKCLSRSEFNEYLLEMQAENMVQLQGGSLPDNDPDKISDSITTELSGLRCYCKLI